MHWRYFTLADQFGACVGRHDRITLALDVFAAAFLAIHKDESEGDLATFFFDGLDGLEGGITGGDDIIDDDHGLIRGEVTFDALATSVTFGLFADDEGLDRVRLTGKAGTHGDGERDGVCSHGQATE